MKDNLPRLALCLVLLTTKSQGQGSMVLWGSGNSAGAACSAAGGEGCSTHPTLGPYSMSMGYQNISEATLGIVLGYRSYAAGYGAYAQGGLCGAYGDWSRAMGVSSETRGGFSEAQGYYCVAHGAYSVAQGYSCYVNGDLSVAMGNQAAAYGRMNRAYGDSSVAGDSVTNNNSSNCYAFGFQSAAKNNNSVALGANSQAFGAESKAVGASSVASGTSAVTLGESATASGEQSTAIGQGSKALALHAVAAGPFPVARGNPSAWVATDPVFTVANGQSDSTRSNALVVLKSGAVLVKPAGDLSMGAYTVGIRPDDAAP